MKIYFDNAATTKAFEKVADIVSDYMTKEYFNPSSPYSSAMHTERKIDEVRKLILKHLNLKGELIFTSGGTESNNLAIKGALSKLRNPDKIITSQIEHPSVKSTCAKAAKELGCQLVTLPVDSKGHISKDALRKACEDADTALVSIMHVNNETGTVQGIEELAKIAKENIKNCVFHCDGVQAFMKAQLPDAAAQVDLYSISAHKIHGPKGVGALYVRDKNLITPIVSGGGQEDGFRSGTYNTAGIMGLGKAVEIISSTHDEYTRTMKNIKKIILNELKGSDIDYIICGDDPEQSAPHILNIAFKGIMGEVLLSALDGQDLLANTGSACSSKKAVVSPVLKAMNIDRDYIHGALRLSFGAFSTEDEAKASVKIIISSIQRLRRFKRA